MAAPGLNDVFDRARRRKRFLDAPPSREWLVYGAGRTGQAWAVALAADGCKVRGFIDQHVAKAGSLPVYRLHECPDALRRSAAVVICVHNPGVSIASVQRDLSAAGYGQVWLLQDLIDRWPSMSHFWLAPSTETLPYAEEAVACAEAFEDERSRSLYTAILDMRINSNSEGLPQPRLGRHYFPDDLPAPELPINFVDCGAYTGDTILSFRQGGLSFGEIAAFEPDPNHYPALCRALASERAHAFPCGVWDVMTQLRFTSDDSASHISAHGEVVVQTLSLDQALPNFPANFIKMDIEGAERQALMGARAMISRCRPRLAISVYHKPRDLWELIRLVQGWDLDYTFYLRSHAFNSFETVFYGVPET